MALRVHANDQGPVSRFHQGPRHMPHTKSGSMAAILTFSPSLTDRLTNRGVHLWVLIRRSQVRALVGEPKFNRLASFELSISVIFSVIFIRAYVEDSSSIKTISDRERRTLDPQVVGTFPAEAESGELGSDLSSYR